MKLEVMHADVHVAKSVLGTILLCSLVLQTQQKEIESPWNSRLYPTNSVYEVPQAPSVQSSISGNNVLGPRAHVEVSSESEEDPGGGEEEYDEEYETDSAHQEESESKQPEESKEYDYSYDDDDDNGTYSQASDAHVHDFTFSNESLIEEHDQNGNRAFSGEEELSDDADEEFLIGEAVVSVVTTKSVVNGTFSVPTSQPMTTEQMLAPPTRVLNTTMPPDVSSTVATIESTEDPRIVASVQTSRSISGARFLPFNFNADDQSTDRDSADEPGNKTTPSESTESIIDKLDRVQSELSSGFLNGGFRTAPNALQLDVLAEQSTKKTFTTTGRAPIISKFVPRQRVNNYDNPTTEPTARTTEGMMNDAPAKPRVMFKIPWPGSPRPRPSTTQSSRITAKKAPARPKSVAQDISAFLPPGYKLKEDDATTEKSVLSDILAKSNFNIASLLPADYKPSPETPSEVHESTTKESKSPKFNLESLFASPKIDISAFLPPDFKTSDEPEVRKPTTAATPIQKTLQELFSKSSVDISAFVPPEFNVNPSNDNKKVMTIEKQVSLLPEELTSTTPAGFKLVFPTRPGGRKAVSKTTTTSAPGRHDPPTPVVPKIQKGWATRSTTEFTGWHTPSTTPISIEKLLEAARTATISSANSSAMMSTSEVPITSTTTTTTTTIRPTTPGVCQEECEVAGTIRIIGNATWVPELLNRNTNEWQQLAGDIEKEMNLVFLKSAILRKWFKNVRIDAFSQGSILVDYFVELQELTQKINTQELKVIFHDSLRTYNAHRWNETKVKGPMRLGVFVIDPKSTDFVVIPKVSLPQQVEKDDRLIPQWAIAVIVIGVGGLLFIIIFGVSVLVNRQNAAKLKPGIAGMYGEEAAKNIIQSSHIAATHRSSQDYPKSEISTIWNDTDGWREKSFESHSNNILVDAILPDDKKYNVYDSWRSEWNGYYYQPSHSSSKFAGYESTAGFSRHTPDYDPNF